MNTPIFAGMLQEPRHRIKRLVVPLIATLGLLAGLLLLSLDSLFELALRRVALLAEPSGYRVRFNEVDVRWRAGQLTVRGLHVGPDSTLLSTADAAHFTFTADDVFMQGVNLPALLWDRVLQVGRLSVDHPALEHSHITGGLDRLTAAQGMDQPSVLDGALARIRVDTLEISAASGRSRNRAMPERALEVQELDARVLGLRFVETSEGRLLIEDDDARILMRGMRMGLPPFHTLTIEELRMSTDTEELCFTHVRYTPEHGPKQYHRHVDHQQELISADADTVIMRGFDVAGNLYHGALLARTLQVEGGQLHIHRDKSVPRGEAVYKPLPAAMVHGLAVPVSFDTIVLHNVDVHYGERQMRQDEYGTLSFTGIHGTLTGLSNLPAEHPDDLVLSGLARLYERGSLELVLRMPMDGEKDRLSIEATLRDLPFQVLNRMTNATTHVTALGGRIHRVEVSFAGDDERATGTVDVRYQDLKLRIGGDIRHARALSLLANTLVRGQNMPGDRHYRKGSFMVERATDKGVFNYLWNGIRTGMMEVMLPKAVFQQVRKAEDASADTR